MKMIFMFRIFLVFLLVNQCQSKSEMRSIQSGVIQYDISIVLPEDCFVPAGYSKDFYRALLASNTPSKQTVYFNGHFSKTEAINTDYDYKSQVEIIRNADHDTYFYCKAFPYLKFCIPVPIELPITERPPSIEYHEEFKEILGYDCQKVTITESDKLLNTWVTKEVKVQDPTKAVIQYPGIDGLILEFEEIPFSNKTYFYKRYTVSSIEEQNLDDLNFQISPDYLEFSSINEAQQENLSRMEKELASINGIEKPRFKGIWELNTGKGSLIIRIEDLESNNANKYNFTSYQLLDDTALNKILGSKNAQLVGKKLWVVDAHNFKIYIYNPVDDLLINENNELFTYKRLGEREILKIEHTYSVKLKK